MRVIGGDGMLANNDPAKRRSELGTGKSSLTLLIRSAFRLGALVMLAWVCLPVSEAIERPGDADNAQELRRSAVAVAAIQRQLRGMAESAPREERFELYRTYDDSMGTWLQVAFLRTLLGAAIATRSPSDESRFRTNLRDHARYALWELDRNIAHLDASAAGHGSARYLRLIDALRSSSVNVRTTIVRLAAEP